jgi:hypothetical protein
MKYIKDGLRYDLTKSVCIYMDLEQSTSLFKTEHSRFYLFDEQEKAIRTLSHLDALAWSVNRDVDLTDIRTHFCPLLPLPTILNAIQNSGRNVRDTKIEKHFGDIIPDA